MRHFPLQILATSVLFLGGCGPTGNGVDPNDSDSVYQTGADLELNTNGTGVSESETHIPYTIAGGSDDFNKLREELFNNTDIDLAKRIFTVEVQTISRGGTFTLINPEKITVKITLKPATTEKQSDPETLTFSGPLSIQGEQVVAKDLSFKNYFVSTSCLKTKCTAISLRFTPKGGKTVGILYRVTTPKIRVVSGETESYRSSTLNQMKQNGESGIDAKRVSVSVFEGPSFTTIETPTLEIRTPLLDTREMRSHIEDVKFSGSSVPTISASLVGNDPSTGSLHLDIEATDTQEKARLIVEEPEVEPAPAVPVKAPQSQPVPTAPPSEPGFGIFSPTIDPELKPNVTRTTKAFSLYSRDPETQRMMRVWQGLEKNTGACARGSFGSRRLMNFVRLAPNVAETVKAITEEIDVTPEIACILAIESNFLNQDSYPTKEARKYKNKSGHYVLAGDLGPWQIVFGTASHINNNLFDGSFKVFDITRNRSKIEQDDRTYFEQATYMAAIYFRYLFNQFKYDPGVAVLAYHAGPGDAGKFVRYADGKTGIDSKKRESFINDLAHFRTSLSDIRNYRIQLNKVCAQINYAYAFLGALTLGQNLNQYSINTGTEKAPKMVPLNEIQRSTSTKYKERLSRSGGPSPRNQRKP